MPGLGLRRGSQESFSSTPHTAKEASLCMGSFMDRIWRMSGSGCLDIGDGLYNGMVVVNFNVSKQEILFTKCAVPKWQGIIIKWSYYSHMSISYSYHIQRVMKVSGDEFALLYGGE